MTAPAMRAVVAQLANAGLSLFLSTGGGLGVVPSSHLTADLRNLIRSSKAQLINWLMAANDASSHAHHPPDNPEAWNEIAAAYHAHHFKCLTCIAAGRGSQYGQRCSVGMTLWLEYIPEIDLSNS